MEKTRKKKSTLKNPLKIKKIGPTQIWGPSELSYFEEVPKTASRLPKIAQKQSQNDYKMG